MTLVGFALSGVTLALAWAAWSGYWPKLEPIPTPMKNTAGPDPPKDQRHRDPVTGVTGEKAGDPKIVRVGSEALRFRWCPAGSFKMGSPAVEEGSASDEAQVDMTLTRGFWMLETEVTQGLWQAARGTKLDWSSKGEGPDLPVYNVSHGDAEELCNKLTGELRADGQLPAGWRIALPTEAQWEYAARAGTTSRFPFGADANALEEYAWYGATRGEDFTRRGRGERMRGESQICWGTSASGAPMGIRISSRVGLIRAARLWPRTGWPGAVAGSTTPGSAGRRTATGSRR